MIQQISHLMAAMAPELWPMMMVFSSQCSSVSMKGSQMLSRAVTRFRIKSLSFDRDSLSLILSYLSNRQLTQQFTTSKTAESHWEMGPKICMLLLVLVVLFLFFTMFFKKILRN